jgi:hypothetical protein
MDMRLKQKRRHAQCDDVVMSPILDLMICGAILLFARSPSQDDPALVPRLAGAGIQVGCSTDDQVVPIIPQQDRYGKYQVQFFFQEMDRMYYAGIPITGTWSCSLMTGLPDSSKWSMASSVVA